MEFEQIMQIVNAAILSLVGCFQIIFAWKLWKTANKQANISKEQNKISEQQADISEEQGKISSDMVKLQKTIWDSDIMARMRDKQRENEQHRRSFWIYIQERKDNFVKMIQEAGYPYPPPNGKQALKEYVLSSDGLMDYDIWNFVSDICCYVGDPSAPAEFVRFELSYTELAHFWNDYCYDDDGLQRCMKLDPDPLELVMLTWIEFICAIYSSGNYGVGKTGLFRLAETVWAQYEW